MELARNSAGSPVADLYANTCCLTLLAGAGTRWVRSLAAAKKRYGVQPGDYYERLVAGFPLEAPRGLFPVRNFMAVEPERIPLAAYAVDAVRGLGRHVLVVRGWETEIRSGIIRVLGIADGQASFCTQGVGPSGKVLGHGDAAKQSRERWRQSNYLVANFGGDANSPLTALTSLLTIARMNEIGVDVGLLLPVARIGNPVYPIILDDEGLPQSFGHDKLGGTAAVHGSLKPDPDGFAYSNVGIRVYRTDALLAAMEEIVNLYWREGIGYSIPGNDPEAHEFALDNVDALLATRGQARILAIANPEELTPVKSFDEIGNFEAAVEKVRKEWKRYRSTLDPQ
jgi:hypothetical protein